MNLVSTPKKLLEKQGIHYDLLPVLPEKSKLHSVGRVVRKICSTLLKMTVIGAVVILAFKFLGAAILKHINSKNKKLTPLGQKRLQEAEERIRDLAKTVGLANAEKLCVKASKQGPAAQGNSMMLLSPSYLVRPEDLPAELDFTRLDSKEITEEEWAVMFNEWVHKNIFKTEDKPKSQLQVDLSIEYGKAFLRIYKNPQEFSKAYEGVIGHELGHCFYNHTRTHILAGFGWDLLALPTLGISTLFKEKILNKLCKKQEVDADLFSKKSFSSDGMIRFFKEYRKAGKILHTKYPDRFDKQGGNKKDHHHPSLSERIAYLQVN